MATPIFPKASHKPKIYRFALYGRKNSGKTCILAALAMDRRAHPDGLSCTWIEPPSHALKQAGNSTGESSESIASAFTLGKEWLEQGMRNLARGERPAPNPNDKTVFRFMYDFTTTDHRTFLVELIDYSGELIDPDLSDTQLATALRQHLLSMDGILVLAETPHPNQPLHELYTELTRLKRAFAALRGEKMEGPALDIPVALLINKWDRRCAADAFTSALSDHEVSQFLNSQPEPPQKGLVDSLRGAVTAESFKVFPVSAFGKHVSDEHAPRSDRNGVSTPERPAQVNPLCSFGLEDGFVWACRRRDTIDLREYENAAATRKWWRPFQLVAWNRRRSLKARAGQLERRFPKQSDENRRVQVATRHVKRAFVGQCAVMLAAIVLVYLGLGANIDYLGYRKHRPTIDNLQAADKSQLSEAETWLETYSQNAGFFHIGFRPFYGADAAAGQLVAIRERKKDLNQSEWQERWQEVQKAPDPVTQEGLARKLRDDMQASPFVDDAILAKCRGIVEQCESNRKIRENESAVQAVEAEFSNLLAAKRKEKDEYLRLRRRAEELPIHKDGETKKLTDQRVALIQQINDHLDGIEKSNVTLMNGENIAFIKQQDRKVDMGVEVPDLELMVASVKRGLPHPDIATSDIQQQYAALKLKAHGKLDDAVRRRDWLRFEDDYHQLVRGGNMRSAAQRLVEKSPETPELGALKGHFCKSCLPHMKEKKEELVKGKQWSRGREVIKVLRTDKYVKQLLPDDSLRLLEDLEHDVNIAEDRHLYNLVENQKTRTLENAQKYLDDAPLKSMKKKVEDYRDYLKKKEGKLDLEVEASVMWGVNCWENYKNSVKVSLDNAALYDEESTSNHKKPSDLDKRPFTRKLSDKINVNVAIKVTSGIFIFSSREHGQGTFEGKVSDLQGGKTIELDKYGNKVILKIREQSLPQEPALPEWRE